MGLNKKGRWPNDRLPFLVSVTVRVRGQLVTPAAGA